MGDSPAAGLSMRTARISMISFNEGIAINVVHFTTRMPRREGIQAMSDIYQLMPETSEINFYTADPDLPFLLHQSLSTEDFERAQDILTELGEIASKRMDKLAEVANRQGPVLQQFDKRGERVDKVIFHPSYHELEHIAYEDFAIAACCHREGALGWTGKVPQPGKFALGYLGMQAESGVFCPVSMTDALARVLERYASDALKRRFLPALTALKMDELKQGAMFLTEKQGGSDVGLTSTVAKPRSENNLSAHTL